MKMKLFLIILFLLNSIQGICQTKDEPVEILDFYSSHCHACQVVKERIFPRIKEKYGDKIRIAELNIGETDNYIRFLELQNKYNWHPKQFSTPTVFIDGRFLVGSEQIEKYLDLYIEIALSTKEKIPISKLESKIDLASRFKAFSPFAVISAGLIDGINPCAFTVIIFFVSFLTLQGYGKFQILAIGLSFILAVFITYVLIGLGLFNFLYQLKAYWIVVRILYIAGALLCFILAGLAFYDFVRFLRTRKTQGLVLQLPEGLKQRIHWIIGFYYRKGKDAEGEKSRILRLVLSAFVVGFFVSLFEAVCTGQVYLPTIIFILKATPLKVNALFYLLLYNLMFIIPLWIIMLLALWGVSSQQFSNFAQRHIGTIKILMMALFLGLGFFLMWRA